MTVSPPQCPSNTIGDQRGVTWSFSSPWCLKYHRWSTWRKLRLEKLSGYLSPLITYDTGGSLRWGNCQVTSLWTPIIGVVKQSGYFPLITLGGGNCLVTSLWSLMILEEPCDGETVSLLPFDHLIWYLGWGNCHKMKYSLLGLFDMPYKCRNYVKIVTWQFPHPKAPPFIP